jgi:hypothetical protein
MDFSKYGVKPEDVGVVRKRSGQTYRSLFSEFVNSRKAICEVVGMRNDSGLRERIISTEIVFQHKIHMVRRGEHVYLINDNYLEKGEASA